MATLLRQKKKDKLDLYGPFHASGDASIDYLGNRIIGELGDIKSKEKKYMKKRGVKEIATDELYYHLHNIDNSIFKASVNYFNSIGADWCNLPLTTLMISSPGEVYAGKKLDYTTDTLPIKLKWFDSDRDIFLSESSQFYLELRLCIPDIDKVFSIYNSFRKEKADFSHLSEFQHIEFEGHVSFEENVNIAVNLLDEITKFILKHNYLDLNYFLRKNEIDTLQNVFHKKNFEWLTFREALACLYKETHNPKYKEFSLKHFSSWEEIKLTEIVGKHVIVTEFPLMQIPFYHNNIIKDSGKDQVAQNADIILYRYREVVGSGLRIFDTKALAQKARMFNLPLDDYEPYLATRKLPNYRKSAGFGLGWQRYTQWLLKTPFIWDVVHVPRTHYLPTP